MQLNDLRPAEGAKKARKRVGRGNSSGHGTYSGRGVNGQLSRSGGGKGPNFEGGQMKLSMRLPKLPGFRNVNTVRIVFCTADRTCTAVIFLCDALTGFHRLLVVFRLNTARFLCSMLIAAKCFGTLFRGILFAHQKLLLLRG